MSRLAADAPAQQRTTEFRLFGPDILIRNGKSIDLPTGGPRELLALLLLEPGRRISERDYREAIRTRRYRSVLFSSAELIRNALTDTGISIKIIGNRYKAGEDLICRIDGEPLVVDLYQCGPHILDALGTDNATEILDEIAAAWKIMEHSPLVGLGGAHFIKWRRFFAEARRDVFDLADSLIRQDPQATCRSIFDRVNDDRGLQLEQHAIHQPAKSNIQDPQHSIPGLKLRFLKAMEGNPIGRIWGLPLPDSKGGSERAQDIHSAMVESSNGERVIAAARWWSLQQRTMRFFRQSQDTSAIAVSIYLSDGQAHQAVEEALELLLAETSLESYGHEEPVIGSWYRRFWVKAREETAHLNAAQIAAEVERKIRMEVFDKAQAVIDNQQATGAAALISAIQGEERACIRVGSILVIKVDGLVLVNNLTQMQLSWLERNQMLLRDPEALLKGLEALPDSMQDLIELPPESASQGAL